MICDVATVRFSFLIYILSSHDPNGFKCLSFDENAWTQRHHYETIVLSTSSRILHIGNIFVRLVVFNGPTCLFLYNTITRSFSATQFRQLL